MSIGFKAHFYGAKSYHIGITPRTAPTPTSELGIHSSSRNVKYLRPHCRYLPVRHTCILVNEMLFQSQHSAIDLIF
jgi:hypothetical protein